MFRLISATTIQALVIQTESAEIIPKNGHYVKRFAATIINLRMPRKSAIKTLMYIMIWESMVMFQLPATTFLAVEYHNIYLMFQS